MATIEYSLFRAKFVKPRQQSLFDPNLTAAQLFLSAILEKPSAEIRTGYMWHIGNLQPFDDDNMTGYFAVGRTTNATVEKFDPESKNFLVEELETSPYTHVVFDASIGILGIAKKTSLAPTAKGIASKIEMLLQQTTEILKNEITVEVRPIPDPDGFLKAVLAAYRVSRFTATFRGPNPIDADALFQKPLAVYCSKVNGEKGKVQVQGADLDREVISEVARSSAATGNETSARIHKTASQKPITISMSGDPIKKKYDEDIHNPEGVLHDMKNLYQKIHSND